MANKLQMQKGSLMQMGYGIIPRRVMIDKRLTAQAKTIYAYLASHSGANDQSFPSIETITDHLGISENTFYTHRKLLVKHGYVKIIKRKHEKGVYENNLYILQQSGF